jgi:hypothetical protein
MSIQYGYEITSVDQTARCMEVVYTADGRQTMHIGARLPYEGESLEAVVAMYAPVAYWLEQQAAVTAPSVGVSGVMGTPVPETLASAKAKRLAEIAAWRYQKEVSGITYNNAQINTDRESQAQITSAYTGLKNGLLTSVNWKAANGQWVEMTLTAIEPIAGAVANHVQSCFNAEKALAQQVNAAETIEAVNAVTIV